MIRSARIPAVLDRVCDGDVIQQALLVTADGELLGCSTSAASHQNKTMSASFGTLVADIAVDYQRLGEEYATALPEQQRSSSSSSSSSHLQCLLIEMDLGLVAVTACRGVDCFVLAVASPGAPLGLVKARLQVLAVHVQESLSTLTETT